MLSPMHLSAAALAFVLAFALACGRAEETPEERVRAALAAIEAAAEAREPGDIKDHISESYQDEHGNDRRAVLGIATGHVMRNKSVYILSRIGEIEFPDPATARVDALVALAGTPIEDAAALAGVRADLYRFDVQLREEGGTWRVTSAAWRPAALSDFQ